MGSSDVVAKVYPMLSAISKGATQDTLERQVVPYLIQVWLRAYWRNVANSDVVETRQSDCSFLFDIQLERLIAAWAISKGKHKEKRDASRMRGHPQGFGDRYHRGHAIPHSGGGPADINLVPQLGALNVGNFRVLEREYVAAEGSLYFTHWIYRDKSQKPAAVEQGLLRPGCAPDVALHRN